MKSFSEIPSSLGRITEVGESNKNYSTFPDSVDNGVFPANISNSNTQRTYTMYTAPPENVFYIGKLPQRFGINRVSYAFGHHLAMKVDSTQKGARIKRFTQLPEGSRTSRLRVHGTSFVLSPVGSTSILAT